MRGKEYPRCVVAPSTIADLSAREAIRFEIHLALHGTSNLSNPIFYPAERGIASPFYCRFFHALLSWISIGKKKKKKFSRRNVSNIIFPLRGERKSKIYRKVSISIADCHGFILVGKLVEKRIENSNDTFFVHFSLRPVRKSVVKRAVTIERAPRKEKQYFRNLYNFPRFETIESRFTSVISETGYETYLHSPGTEHVFLTLSLSLSRLLNEPHLQQVVYRVLHATPCSVTR